MVLKVKVSPDLIAGDRYTGRLPFVALRAAQGAEIAAGCSRTRRRVGRLRQRCANRAPQVLAW